MMAKFLSEAIKLQGASLKDDFSPKDKVALKETLCSVVDFFSVPNKQTFDLLQQQLDKSTSEMAAESKVSKSTSSQGGKLKKFFGILGVLVGGIGAVFASTAAAPVAIAGFTSKKSRTTGSRAREVG